MDTNDKHYKKPTEAKSGQVETLFEDYKLRDNKILDLFSDEADELGSTTSNSVGKDDNNTNNEYNNNSNS